MSFASGQIPQLEGAGQTIQAEGGACKTVQQQRDDFLQDVVLAAQVQRLFLPLDKSAIVGLEIAGIMQPAKSLRGTEVPDGARHAVTLAVGLHGLNSVIVGRPRLQAIKAYAENCR
jgi:hypothetical protein